MRILIALLLVLAIGSNVQASEQRNLYWGCQGEDVALLQTQLNSLGFNCGEADGIFGPKTQAAVINLQTTHNLTADGIVGLQTRKVLADLIAKPVRNLYMGCQGDDVARLQNQLNQAGFNCGTADGVFGPKTYAAVVALQKAHGLQVDGVVGPQTRQALSRLGAEPSRDGDENIPRYIKVLDMVATAYCPCAQCNYPYGGQPSYIGLPLDWGIVAVDPNVIPLGTRLYVEGYGEAIAADVGNAIVGNRIDLCYPDHNSALNFGIRNVKVYIMA